MMIKYFLLDFSRREVNKMAKYCEICGKGITTGNNVSHSNRKSKRTWAPNVQRVSAVVDGAPKRLYVCTRCLRSGKVVRG
jgi:large subunit ribosomal protein L28